MTIDEAIKQFEYDAECNRADLDLSYAKDNEQVAEWLKLLKWYEQGMEDIPSESGVLPKDVYHAGYNKAIDDFAGRLIRYVDCGHLCSPTEMRWSDLSVVEMVKKLAEQLKAGGENEQSKMF